MMVKNFLDTKGEVSSVFPNNLPGDRWLKGFAKRCQMSERVASNIRRAREMISQEIMNEFFDELIAMVLVDIFHYFKKSAKRQCEFANMQEMFDVEQKRMLKHVCTRWLSIGRCLTRLLHNWIALKAFFKAEKEMHDKRMKNSDDATEKETKTAEDCGGGIQETAEFCIPASY